MCGAASSLSRCRGFGPRLFYRVLTGPDDAAFCCRVSEALEFGYALYGRPAPITEDGVAYVAEAVVWPGVEPPLRP
ncbi:MAG TPA: DUF1737 domain-containing protein [Luteimicrobium sp.]|nr:DUF1737 domain-containing protein [Luteimicrobium sp.]